jgi:hypothetical protein
MRSLRWRLGELRAIPAMGKCCSVFFAPSQLTRCLCIHCVAPNTSSLLL